MPDSDTINITTLIHLIEEQDRLLKLADYMAECPVAEDEDALAAVVAYRTARNTEEEDQ